MGRPRVMQIQHLMTIIKLFTVSHTFVPTDALGHTKNCGKNTRKSADAVAEFAIS